MPATLTPDTPTPAAWDAFVSAHARAHVLQLSAWADLKSAYGWGAARVALRDATGTLQAGAQLLFKPLPARLGTLAYLPMGGYVSDPVQWPQLWQAVRQTATDHGAAFLKWEPGIYLDTAPPDMAQWGFVESAQTIQPPNTVLIDISADDDSILARMNQGTRRKIRKALKNNIVYRAGNADDVAAFSALMQTTGSRNDFGVHEADYYKTLYALFVPRDYAALLLAEHEGDLLAAVMVFALGDTAWYIVGASSNEKRNLMASYGIQWQAIQWARARGCRWYDLWGVPDADEATLEAQFQQRSDGLWGVYGFKRGWGGQVKRSVGAWDLPYNRLIYTAYRAALRWR